MPPTTSSTSTARATTSRAIRTRRRRFAQPNFPAYDFGGDPRGFAQNDEQTEITTFEARLQSSDDAESRWSWLAGVFYSKEEGHTQFDSFVQGYADTPAFVDYFAYLEYNVYDGTLAPTDQWFLGVYDTDLEQRAVFGEVAFDVSENFTITAGAAGSSMTASSSSTRSRRSASADLP